MERTRTLTHCTEVVLATFHNGGSNSHVLSINIGAPSAGGGNVRINAGGSTNTDLAVNNQHDVIFNPSANLTAHFMSNNNPPTGQTVAVTYKVK